MCANGECTGPDSCTCEYGWTGLQCNRGICDDVGMAGCDNGLCIGPDTCECFYGWTGDACNIAVSYPSCMNGFAIAPDFCQCDDGWRGRVCDVPVCMFSGKDGCGQGYCKDSQTCECYPGWRSSTPESPCDVQICSEVDPMCKKCNETYPYTCTECAAHHYLETSRDGDESNCHRCELNYPHCVNCNEKQCLQCHFPYFVDFETKECVSYGIFEVAQPKLIVDESMLYFDIRIVRNDFSEIGKYSKSLGEYLTDRSTLSTVELSTKRVYTDDTEEVDPLLDRLREEDNQLVSHKYIEVDYDIQPIITTAELKDTRIEKIFGTVEFGPNDREKLVYVKIFKRLYHETDEDQNVFQFNIKFAPKGGQLKHESRTTLIEYYDGYPQTTEMLDVNYTYPLAQGEFDNQQSVDCEVEAERFMIVHSYWKEDEKKETDFDKFFLRIMYNDTDHTQTGTIMQQETPFMSRYVEANMHNISYIVKILTSRELRVYASCKGFQVTYYANIIDDMEPMLTRIEPIFPTRFDLQYRLMTWFRAHIDFVFRYGVTKDFICRKADRAEFCGKDYMSE